MLTFSKCFTVAKEWQQKEQGTQEVCSANNPGNLKGKNNENSDYQILFLENLK